MGVQPRSIHCMIQNTRKYVNYNGNVGAAYPLIVLVVINMILSLHFTFHFLYVQIGVQVCGQQTLYVIR